jgi:signal peptidase I
MKTFLVTAPTIVAGLVLIAAAWLLFAPAELGGATRYAVVEGASMEPSLSRGDLVLVRGGGDADVGDAVLYRDATLGVRVLHRVIAKEAGRLVLQGDANDFVDDARPRPSDVIGAFWFSIPRAGSVLFWLQQPLHAALLAFALTIVGLTGGGAARAAHPEEVRSR